jgi:phosphodiesterase/alkaline phosphatase D-like protein
MQRVPLPHYLLFHYFLHILFATMKLSFSFRSAVALFAGYHLLATKADGQEDTTPIRIGDYTLTDTNPFTLGVASGDPTRTSVTLWTRLAPDPLNGGGMPTSDDEDEASVNVMYQLALDSDMTEIVEEGTLVASSAGGHSVHVTVGGLEPASYYWYQFSVNDRLYQSAVGRTKTLPSDDTEDFKFAFVSCSEYEFGYFDAFRHIAEDDDIDFVIHLGDYIYETGNINPM